MCDEYDAPECMQESFPVARKPHRCCECGTRIQPGEKYQRISGIWPDGPARFLTCMFCVELRQTLKFDCAPFGGLQEMVLEVGNIRWNKPPTNSRAGQEGAGT